MSFGIGVFLGGSILKQGSAKELTDDEARQVCRNHNSHDKLVDALSDLSSAVTEVQLRGYKHLPSMRNRQRAHSNAIRLLAELEGDK